VVSAARRAQTRAKQDVAQARTARAAADAEQAEDEAEDEEREGGRWGQERRRRSSSVDSQSSIVSEPDSVHVYMGGSAGDGGAPTGAAGGGGDAATECWAVARQSSAGSESPVGEGTALDASIREFKLGSHGARAAIAVANAELAVARLLARKQGKGTAVAAGDVSHGAAQEDPQASILAQLERAAAVAVTEAEKAEFRAAECSSSGHHGFSRLSQDKGLLTLGMYASAVLRAATVTAEAAADQARDVTLILSNEGTPEALEACLAKMKRVSDALWDGVCGRLAAPLGLVLLPFCSNLPLALLLLPGVVRLCKAMAELTQYLHDARSSCRDREAHEQRMLLSQASREQNGSLGEQYESPPAAAARVSALMAGSSFGGPADGTVPGHASREGTVVSPVAGPSGESGGAPGRAHWLVDLLQTFTVVGARMAATAVAGVPEGRVENSA